MSGYIFKEINDLKNKLKDDNILYENSIELQELNKKYKIKRKKEVENRIIQLTNELNYLKEELKDLI